LKILKLLSTKANKKNQRTFNESDPISHQAKRKNILIYAYDNQSKRGISDNHMQGNFNARKFDKSV